MGSYYYLYNRKCPHCNKVIGEIIHPSNNYDENGQEQGFSTNWCEHCKKDIRIDMVFELSKLETE